jgi:putative oxidoreductase
MTALINLYLRVAHRVEYALAPVLMPTAARFAFAALFAVYFWNSAVTKLGGSISGLWTPSFNAFAQIFPKGAEAAGYDIAAATSFQKLVILAGTWAEFVLPVLLIVGLFTRFAALGMIGFVVVQTLTDLFGHNLINDEKALGAWFDGDPGSLIMDQRLLWIMLLAILLFRGAGPLSADDLLKRRLQIR